MRVVQINATCGIGSTGKICLGISELLNENKIENYILFSSRTSGYPLGISCSDDRSAAGAGRFPFLAYSLL